MSFYGGTSRAFGDYYSGRGDYYFGAGDPGLFDFVKRAARVVGGAALGFVTGGPVGGIIGAAKGTVGAVRSGIEQETLRAGGSGTALTPVMLARHAAVVKRGRGIGQPMIGVMAPRGGVGGQFGRRRRRMNVANIKALRRSVRRLVGFKNLVAGVQMSLMGIAGPKRKGRKAKCAACGRVRCVCHSTPLLLRAGD